MNNEQARVILSAYRSGGDDANDPVFVQALEQSRADPELAAWFAKQRATDEKMKTALHSCTPPAHLRDSLMWAKKVTRHSFPLFTRGMIGRLAVAAAIVLGFGMAYFFVSRGNASPTFAKLSSSLLRLNSSHAHAFEGDRHHMEGIREWLASRKAPHDFRLPSGFPNRTWMECDVIRVQGAEVSMICFEGSGGGPAHLYVVDRSRIQDAPQNGKPQFRETDGYAVAYWSDEKYTYIVAVSGSSSRLQKLFAVSDITRSSITANWNKEYAPAS